MSPLSSLTRKIAMPFLAVAVVTASVASVSQPAEAQIGRTGRTLILAGAIVTAGALIGAGASRAGSRCVRQTRCVSNAFGDRACRSVTVC